MLLLPTSNRHSKMALLSALCMFLLPFLYSQRHIQFVRLQLTFLLHFGRIHKHRPKLIDFDSLSKDNKIQNLQTAIDAAFIYFNLEKYLSPEDIGKLDENSMVIYVRSVS